MTTQLVPSLVAVPLDSLWLSMESLALVSILHVAKFLAVALTGHADADFLAVINYLIIGLLGEPVSYRNV